MAQGTSGEKGSATEPRAQEPAPAWARSDPRFPARAAIEIVARGEQIAAETADIGCGGVLVLLRGVQLEAEEPLRLRIQHPSSGETLELPGRVANQTHCDDELTAVGVRFLYELERSDEVARFVDDLRGLRRTGSPAPLSGSLAEAPLEDVLETVANASRAGTLRLQRGQQQGRITYCEGELLCASVGLVSGLKALGRMFCWKDARFEFQPVVEPGGKEETPMPLHGAILAAAVQRDEIRHLDLGPVGPGTAFAVDAERLAALSQELEPLALELCENAALGFPVDVLLDMLAASDARIYATLLELLDAGILRIDGPPRDAAA
jgi:hypothetical protein